MKKTGHEGYSLHGLRKNATIELLEAGCTPDEVKAAIFAKLDANGDGYLSADEFTEAREQRRDRRQGN